MSCLWWKVTFPMIKNLWFLSLPLSKTSYTFHFSRCVIKKLILIFSSPLITLLSTTTKEVYNTLAPNNSLIKGLGKYSSLNKINRNCSLKNNFLYNWTELKYKTSSKSSRRGLFKGKIFEKVAQNYHHNIFKRVISFLRYQITGWSSIFDTRIEKNYFHQYKHFLQNPDFETLFWKNFYAQLLLVILNI